MKKYEKDALWSPIATVNEPIYTPIQIHNLTGYHMHNVVSPPCEYCTDKWLSRNLVWDEQSNLEVCRNTIEVELYDPIDEGYSYATFEIKFCPMCGNRLETN